MVTVSLVSYCNNFYEENSTNAALLFNWIIVHSCRDVRMTLAPVPDCPHRRLGSEVRPRTPLTSANPGAGQQPSDHRES